MSKEKSRCTARQVNRRVPDFECKLQEGAHNIHVDPRTDERWSEGGPPRGMRRKYTKKYANPKLHR